MSTAAQALPVEPMLADRISGMSLRKIGARHGISHTQVYKQTEAAAESHLQATAAAIHKAQDRDETFLIVLNGPIEAVKAGCLYCAWLIEGLERIGVECELRFGEADGTPVVALTDTNYESDPEEDQ